MKNPLLLLLIVFFIGLTMTAQELTCADFKNGTFIVPKASEDSPEYKLVRDGNSQMEIIEMNGQTITLYGILEWIDECSYKLIYDETKMNLPEEIQFVNDNGGIVSEMLKIEDNCFFYKSVLIVDGKETKRIDGKYCAQ
ncbi:hypothetical protein EHW67_18880 [Arenibacter aquaticus]|uniref:Uncharacterized protein n=1 Tax=Arenibacter aquaticus TaxID=2489054 RepID=A0A3S0D3I5_9FLAO|nr:hypothetical protein [Arenibacter aquaticus]RTE52250.1 hypothetical protein EHW67_18880 [Arenibacter aquaticus]